MKFEITTSGDFKNSENWLTRLLTKQPSTELRQIGSSGVSALSNATPVGETGETARGWSYVVSKTSGGWEVAWYNHSHPETYANVAILLQYGHGTGTGGWVPGRDYINPAMSSVFLEASKKLEGTLK